MNVGTMKPVLFVWNDVSDSLHGLIRSRLIINLSTLMYPLMSFHADTIMVKVM